MTPYDLSIEEFYDLVYKDRTGNPSFTLELNGVHWTFHGTFHDNYIKGWNRVDMVLKQLGDKLNGVV